MTQADFTQALLDPAQTVPAGLTDAAGNPAGKRFAVYRNNVAVSLTEALETAFPTLRQLLGPNNFRLLAGVFLRKHPPRSPLMMFYGDAMPDFLAEYARTRPMGYLPDIARLELALRQSYHAADSAALPPGALALSTERLMTARFQLAPAVRLLRSDWPIHAIWWMHQVSDAPKPVMQPQDILITRPAFDPAVHLLPAGGAAFLAALMRGVSLGEAFDAATREFQNFDLTGLLGILLSNGALTGIQVEEGQ